MALSDWIVRLDGTASPPRELIGGKAASIERMRAAGLPVPPAFVITTAACLQYLEAGSFPASLAQEIDSALAWLEQETGRQLGGDQRPLLLSVRSGAAVSMPGMMDTILNLGINQRSEDALAQETGQADFARDTHRRFLELFSAIVLKAPIELDRDSDAGKWRAQIEANGHHLPVSPRAALDASIEAVFESWNTRRARRYREHNGISHDLGTAVTVQAMVFGNLDEHSGTGVIFSRNPLSGKAQTFGEFLPCAQGEDVVSGKYTPLPLSEMERLDPAAHSALLEATAQLEHDNRDIQDIEFTVQTGKLFLLQSRSAKRSPDAAVRAAVEMVDEGLIDIPTALSRVTAEQVRTLLLPRLVDKATEGVDPIAQGEGACPGVAIGVIVNDPGEAETRAAAGEAVVLLRATTSPDDIHGMIAARAIITEHGGSTSHAAVVSRALGRPCVVGIGDHSIANEQQVTVDGRAGTVYAGALLVETPDERSDPLLARLAGWAAERSAVQVVRPSEVPLGISPVAVDDELAAGDMAMLERHFATLSAASGAALANPDIARIAVKAGVTTIVTEPVLPALLAILEERP